MNQKGNVILVVLILAAVVGGYFIYTNYSNLSRVQSRDNRTKIIPSPIVRPKPTLSDATANWKTYSNNNFNFSFQYPTEWKVEEQAKGIILYITENEKQYPIKFNLADFELPDSDEYKNEEITLGNTKFTKQTGLKRKILTFITLTLKQPAISRDLSKDLFYIQFNIPQTNQKKYINQFDQLLKSIQL